MIICPWLPSKHIFSRRASHKKKGITIEHEDTNDEESEDDNDENEENQEKARQVLNEKIKVAISGIDVQKEEWIAVAYPRRWFPAQFIQFDEEQEEAQVIIQ